MNRLATTFWGLLSVTISGCADYSRVLGYGQLPPAASFQLYDSHFSSNQAPALARSGLAVEDVYYRRTEFVAPIARHPSRQLLGHFNWGPFYSPATPDTLDHPSRLTLYTYLKFYADGRLALFAVTTPPERVLLMEPLDHSGYFAFYGDTARYELAARLAPATRLTGRLVVFPDSLVLVPATRSAKSMLMPEV